MFDDGDRGIAEDSWQSVVVALRACSGEVMRLEEEQWWSEGGAHNGVVGFKKGRLKERKGKGRKKMRVR